MPKRFELETIENGFRFIPKKHELTVDEIITWLEDNRYYGRYIIYLKSREDHGYVGWGGMDEGCLEIDVWEFVDSCPICSKEVYIGYCEKCSMEFKGLMEKEYRYCPGCGQKLDNI